MSDKLPIKILVNQSIEMNFFDKPPSINTVLDELKVDGNLMAVAVNNEIIAKQVWAQCELNDGDKLNVFGAIAGG